MELFKQTGVCCHLHGKWSINVDFFPHLHDLDEYPWSSFS